MLRYFAVAATVWGTAACVTVDADPDERPDALPEADGPEVEFDPGSSIIPFGNDLLLQNGRVNLPEQCNESPTQTGLRAGVLNQLDGFGTFKVALRVSFSTAPDMDSLAGQVKLFQVETGEEYPVVLVPGTTVRYSADCTDPTSVPTVNIVPTVPLPGASTFAVAISKPATAGGARLVPSPIWAFVRQRENPVTIEDGAILAERTPFDPAIPADVESLHGIDLLWRAHAPVLAFLDEALGAPRDQLLLAWQFSTQTTTTPLDPEAAGSLAAAAPAAAPAGMHSVTGGDTQAFLTAVLGGETCTRVGCENVGDVLGGALLASEYQIDLSNPLGGTPLAGPWGDPLSPPVVRTAQRALIAFVPASAAPEGGYPTVVFGHGLTRSSQDLFAIGSQLAGQGIASVAIDWSQHGSRAVQVTSSATLACNGSPTPTGSPQCFAAFFSPDLAGTRDNFRQSALDALALIAAIKRCDNSEDCSGMTVDATRIGYLGQSLGALVGALVVANSPDIRTAVLNVGGAGLIDLIEKTASVAIRCSVVNSLIAAGVVTGTPNVTCLGTDWQAQPAYQVFAAAARWVLDPADAANFAAGLRGRPVLIQKVTDDQTIPNYITDQLAALVGLAPTNADVATAATPPPSAAITTAPNAGKLVVYTTLPPNPGLGFPGNTYGHGSLLAPADAGNGGALGTVRMQTDAITYLVQNLLN